MVSIKQELDKVRELDNQNYAEHSFQRALRRKVSRRLRARVACTCKGQRQNRSKMQQAAARTA